MKLTGKILSGSDSLPSANVYVSDSSGKITSANKGTYANMDGIYSIEVSPSDYITASFVGYPKKTVKASEICSKNSCNFDFKLDSSGSALSELIITADKKKPCDTKCKTKRIVIASGIGLAIIVIGVLIYKKVKN